MTAENPASDDLTFDELAGFIAGVQVGVNKFADELRAKALHVGLGSPARCVTCGETWPCEASRHG